MDLPVIVLVILLCLAQRGLSSRNCTTNRNEFNVVKYGAVGDGKTDDSPAFLKAWRDLCTTTVSNPTLIIPGRKTYLLKPVTFSGPCKSRTVYVQVWGTIVAPNEMSAWKGFEISKWLVFSNVGGLTVDGHKFGKIDGQGSIWWNVSCKLDEGSNGGSCGRPTAMRFEHCDGLQLRRLTHLNSQRNHLSISNCNGAVLSDLNIKAPENSPNTDGIDISHSTQVQIKDSSIGTGDDCIAINGGTSFLNITNINCGPGHGISVGSLGYHGANDTVEEIHVTGCSFTRTMNGARIKTWQGGSGYARKISFEHITLKEVNNPIIIDQYYCGGPKCKSNQTEAVAISDITYRAIQGTTVADNAIYLDCSQSVPCTNIFMEGNTIDSAGKGKKASAFCYNAEGKAVATTPEVSCLST